MRTLTAVLATALLAATVAATARATTDPRVCHRATPGGAAQHAYWCAKTAATTAARTAMARHQNMEKWYSPTFCTMTRTVLHWTCTSIDGANQWRVLVVWRATADGWKQAVTITKTV